jgi:predicted nucleic acid-binding protein
MKTKMVVSNASPVMNLAIIGQLDLIQKLFGHITVPQEVWEELTVAGQSKPGANTIVQADWIQVVAMQQTHFFKLLCKDLDVGEAAAIALAVERNAHLILLDESDARNIAELYNLPKTGVIGILTRAKRKHLIHKIKPILDDLREQAHFRIKQQLYETILSEMGE